MFIVVVVLCTVGLIVAFLGLLVLVDMNKSMKD
jgi:hypothetical protein